MSEQKKLIVNGEEEEKLDEKIAETLAYIGRELAENLSMLASAKADLKNASNNVRNAQKRINTLAISRLDDLLAWNYKKQGTSKRLLHTIYKLIMHCDSKLKRQILIYLEKQHIILSVENSRLISLRQWQIDITFHAWQKTYQDVQLITSTHVKQWQKTLPLLGQALQKYDLLTAQKSSAITTLLASLDELIEEL